MRERHQTSSDLARGWAFVLALWLLASALPGCTYTKVVKDPWQDLKQYDADPRSDKPKDEKAEGRKEAEADQGYAILLDTYEGGNADRRARQLAHRLTQEGGMTDVWTKRVGKGVAVYRGQYGDPGTDSARRDLRLTREAQMDGMRPFEKAQIVPLTQGKVASSNSPMDLRRYKGAYTLLVGYYDMEFGKDFRQAAEKAAAVIREGGDEGYYLHTARYSLVTVGIFPPEEIIDGQPSPPAAKLQKKFPYYLSNGITTIQKLGGQNFGERPSSLYKVD